MHLAPSQGQPATCMFPTPPSSSEVILRVNPGKLQSHRVARIPCIPHGLCTLYIPYCLGFCFLVLLSFVIIRGVKEQFNVNYCWQY